MKEFSPASAKALRTGKRPPYADWPSARTTRWTRPGAGLSHGVNLERSCQGAEGLARPHSSAAAMVSPQGQGEGEWPRTVLSGASTTLRPPMSEAAMASRRELAA